MSEQQLRQAWQEPTHAETFDAWAAFGVSRLRSVFESFNEVRLFLENKQEIRGRDFIEVACATGELGRYLSYYHPEFHYRGFDISRPAIERARRKYPDRQYDLCNPNLSDVMASNLRPAVVWARDVVHHQPDPLKYLTTLLAISSEVTVLRIRTRDQGTSVLDPELSCQWHYNHWVPYIILNIDEVVAWICKAIPVEKILIVKRYIQLGGVHNRFVPKDCYYPETGTAETSLYIVHAEQAKGDPEIVVSCREDSDYVDPLWLHGVRYFRRTFSRS